MPNDINNVSKEKTQELFKDFKEKAPELFKELKAKLMYLKKTEGPVEEVIKLLEEAEEKFGNDDLQKSSAKYEEAKGRLIQAIRPIARVLLIIEFGYLVVWLITAYLTYKFPDWWLWKGVIGDGIIAAWYGVLGGITIAIYGIYDHIRLGDFDPRYKLWYVCKPIIGGIFGWFAYGLYVIGFIVVQKNAKTELENPMFVYIIAFLAGFSERFILRMIDKLMQVITSYETTKSEKEESES